MRKYLLLIVVGIMFSCSSDDNSNPDGIQVRICNLSSKDFQNVRINLNDAEKNYGIVHSNGYSGYKKFDTAYSYGFIHIEADGQTYELIPIDYVGETFIEDGKYTYYINLTTSSGQYKMTAYLQQN